MQRFAEKLRLLRERHGMTQRKLASELGVSYAYIHKLETGQRKPNIEFALKLAKLFAVTIDQLVNDEIALEGMEGDSV